MDKYYFLLGCVLSYSVVLVFLYIHVLFCVFRYWIS